MYRMPAHVHCLIDDYLTELHAAEQKERFLDVLNTIGHVGVSPNEDMPELVHIVTGAECESKDGWSKRVSEALSSISQI